MNTKISMEHGIGEDAPIAQAVVGIFESRARADEAMNRLRNAGFPDVDVSMVAHLPENSTTATPLTKEEGAEIGAITGAAAGGAGGAALGVSILIGAIPVVGPVLAIGALGTILINAVGGAAALSLAGALTGWGLSGAEAEFCESAVKAGQFLVTVRTQSRATEAREILDSCGAVSSDGSAVAPV